MKILEIISNGMLRGGISSSIINYYKHINKDEFQIDFASTVFEEDYLELAKKNNSKVFYVINKKKHPLRYIKQLTKIIKDEKYDIVQAHGSSSMLFLELLAAKKAGCKVRIAHSHNTRSDYPMLDWILRPLFYKSLTTRFACGDDAGRFLFKKRDFFVINNALELEKFKFNPEYRRKIRNKFEFSDDTKVLCVVANFNYQKNHEYLLKIVKELPNKYKLLLIGNGPLKENLEKQVLDDQISDRVIFVGEVTDVEKYLSASDIFILTSRFEGLPVVLIEAQASGIPCVISDRITKKVKITDLVSFQSIDVSPKEWCNTISKINTTRTSTIDENIKLAGFDVEIEAKKLEQIYKNLCKKEK